ncbi:HAD-superfamily class IIA hydrolase, TIGR01459 [Paracoccus alcaliphilus]|uniref:HAD-superfamily class IIA hydrolase, TIGR01459 n=1 Tax=Paracoccus alcaliphilus TaxID=34002 RepID=A0A1H8DUJ7_9RHOB|nr:TIGR01459 family HAD-type hydrolase [Paracoccus alcaliphilus]WCR16908.1 TIGR01459 family HAD-type hydrolase [Paracoccus alcaliphilus]SEN10952.1 HAD-superfamily class IIA hydrolase, TIGR01459 [Paracoccus alcaliphilus]
MTRIIESLSQIGADYDALFCDLWGCLHNGKTAYPAAIAALQQFRRGGGKVCLMTNAPRPNPMVERQLNRMGVPTDAWDIIVSSGDATQAAMLDGAVGRRVWHLGPDKDDSFFELIPPGYETAEPITRVALDKAEGIICTGLFDDLTEAPEDYRTRLTQAQALGLPMLSANPDIVVDMGEDRIYCAGALAELYEELGGKVSSFGKPHAPIYDRARNLLGLGSGARYLAVGDGINTDILGATREGIDALFVTGGLAADSMGPDVENPEPERLTEWLATRQQDPKYSIGRLR